MIPDMTAIDEGLIIDRGRNTLCSHNVRKAIGEKNLDLLQSNLPTPKDHLERILLSFNHKSNRISTRNIKQASTG